MPMMVTPLSMGLIVAGTFSFGMGIFMTLFRFYSERKENIIDIDDVLLWSGLIMIVTSLILAF